MSTYSVDMDVAIDRQGQIQAENTSEFQSIMFQGGVNAEAVQASARMLLATQRILQDNRPLVTRDSAKITEIAEHFYDQDQEQAAQIRS